MFFERARHDLLPTREFIVRMIRCYLFATAFLAFSLFVGIVGFNMIEGFNFKMALVNAASMLGSVDLPYPPKSGYGMLFAAWYGLFAETVFLLAVATLLAPVIHRIYHRFHLIEEE